MAVVEVGDESGVGWRPAERAAFKHIGLTEAMAEALLKRGFLS